MMAKKKKRTDCKACYSECTVFCLFYEMAGRNAQENELPKHNSLEWNCSIPYDIFRRSAKLLRFFFVAGSACGRLYNAQGQFHEPLHSNTPHLPTNCIYIFRLTR